MICNLINNRIPGIHSSNSISPPVSVSLHQSTFTLSSISFAMLFKTFKEDSLGPLLQCCYLLWFWWTQWPPLSPTGLQLYPCNVMLLQHPLGPEVQSFSVLSQGLFPHSLRSRVFFLIPPPLAPLIPNVLLMKIVDPALLLLKSLLSFDGQPLASFCFGEARLVQVVFARWCSQISPGQIAKWEGPRSSAKVGWQSRAPSLVWCTKHCHVCVGCRLAQRRGQPGSQTAACPCYSDWNGCAFPLDQRHCNNFTKWVCLFECAVVTLTSCQKAMRQMLFSLLQPSLIGLFFPPSRPRSRHKLSCLNSLEYWYTHILVLLTYFPLWIMTLNNLLKFMEGVDLVWDPAWDHMTGLALIEFMCGAIVSLIFFVFPCHLSSHLGSHPTQERRVVHVWSY